MPELRVGAWMTGLALCAGAAACSSSSVTSGTAPLATADVGTVSCSRDPRTTPYAAGLTQDGTAHLLKFVLMGSDPTPPTVDTNTWTVKVLDASGAPVTNATFSKLNAYMPDHNHGWNALTSSPNPDGTYTIGNIYLFMSGYWQVSMTATSGTTVDSTTFNLCIGG